MLNRGIPASLCDMAELRLAELSAATVEAVNNMSLKPGQAEFLAPESYEVAAGDVDPQTMNTDPTPTNSNCSKINLFKI